MNLLYSENHNSVTLGGILVAKAHQNERKISRPMCYTFVFNFKKSSEKRFLLDVCSTVLPTFKNVHIKNGPFFGAAFEIIIIIILIM